jgi:hypothetical protein
VKKTSEDKKRFLKSECNRRYYKKYPWSKFHRYASTRCSSQKYKRYGVRMLLTKKEIEYLWIRDRADLLTRPSIDRINSFGDYTLNNCRFIELSENLHRPRIRKRS